METAEKRVVTPFYETVNSSPTRDLDEVSAADLEGHAGAESDHRPDRSRRRERVSCGPQAAAGAMFWLARKKLSGS